MDLNNLLTERRIRVIHPKNSLTTKGLKQLKRMGIEFSENCDAFYEFHRNYEKDEVHIRHMGLSPVEVNEIEWYFRPRELEENKFVKKVVIQGDTVHLKRAFEFTNTLPNLNRVSFIIGRRETVDFHYNFGVTEMKMIPRNVNVSELDITVDWLHYVKDSEKGKEITKKLILATARTAKNSYPSIRKLKIHLPKTEDILKVVENLWSFYFPKVEFEYTTDIKDGLSKVMVSHEEQLSILPSPPLEEEKISALGLGLGDVNLKLVSPQLIPTKQKIRRVSSHSSVSSQITVETEVFSDQCSAISADEYDPGEDIEINDLNNSTNTATATTTGRIDRHDVKSLQNQKQGVKKFKRPYAYGSDNDVSPPRLPPPAKKQKSLEDFAKNNEFVRPKRRREEKNLEPRHFGIPIKIPPVNSSSHHKSSKSKTTSSSATLPLPPISKELMEEWEHYFEEEIEDHKI